MKCKVKPKINPEVKSIVKLKPKEKKNSAIVVWIWSVVILSILPLVIDTVLYYLAEKNIFDDIVKFTSQLFFFTIMLSADSLKNISGNKAFDDSKTLNVIIFSSSIILIIFSSLLYGLVISTNMGLHTNIFSSARLKQSALFVSLASFSVDLTVQIVQIKKRRR